MTFENVVPMEIVFEKELYSCEFSVIFLILLRSQTCIMKVHRGRGPRKYYEPEDRELDIHVLEATAYRRLKEQGLCDRGIVPQFLGTLEKFDPRQCRPFLDAFIDDEYLPSAIFLEYIPNMEMIHLHNCTEKRLDGLVRGIREIHAAYIEHGDPRPRNIMVFDDDPERVVWIDFDRADTYDKEQITDEQKERLSEEEAIVLGLRECLELDLPKGKLKEAYIFYCT
ncbi:hypothetical protein BDV25DRAFT_129396 [Aspergillus avenaceus]|uniref:Protein kinase domain-containing protein n=1 Tax=Aspergillus avenaceus TaxID=36643 RepID=A0A5N6TW68_ASPAV|nr:hypothetical protein BDV25DRAFT_129396 [Aspergillus avenaceus]